MRKSVFALLAALVGSVALLVGAPATSSAQVTGYPTYCPQLTDSIYRLYSAYFLREPDLSGWDYWMNTYGSARDTNLDVVSDSFALSKEFQLRYGQLSNTEFVHLIYNNVMQREPDPVGLQWWTDSLNRGYPRGSVMIAFSESAEYVARTHTIQPQAGYLRWYDAGFQFDCGVRLPLPSNTVEIPVPKDKKTGYYADIFLMNPNPDPAWHFTASVSALGGPDTVNIFAGYNGGESAYVANIALTPKTTALRITGTNQAYWSVVFYDAPPATDRDGYPSAHPWKPAIGAQTLVTGGRDITDLSRFPIPVVPSP